MHLLPVDPFQSAISLSPACSNDPTPRLSTSTSTMQRLRASQANCRVQHTARCLSVQCSQEIVRRSGNYQPSIWDSDTFQSINNEFAGKCYVKQAEKLKKDVKEILFDDQVADPLRQLEMIDDLQRLGVFWHFEAEIKTILENIYNNFKDSWHIKEDLYATSLKFRLFRQHGFPISPEIFGKFKDNVGNFVSSLCNDIVGLLYLYEASYLSFENETILDEARHFSTRNLENYQHKRDVNDEFMTKMITHALELPLHWRVPRFEARWFIEVYRKRPNMNPCLLRLAILDFNMVQATHLEDLRHVFGWWKSTGLGENLSFARDRLVENFLWTVGQQFKPHFCQLRRSSTIVNTFITTIDDIYDVYGTLDELQPFTEAIERWDVTTTMEKLPYYMKLCFLGLFNNVNEMGYNTLRDNNLLIIPYLKSAWADLCKSYMMEATWYHNGYKPSFEEYMNNGWISISGPLGLTHAYFLSENPITLEAVECLEKCPKLIQLSSKIVRLADDLGTSKDEMERGDVPKSIQCIMYETGVSEEDARAHIKHLIGETWKKMNEEQFVDSPFSKTFIEIVMNFARMAQCMYQHGDGHAAQDQHSKDRVYSLLIDPIPFDESIENIFLH